jgi:hypothetical protein
MTQTLTEIALLVRGRDSERTEQSEDIAET